MSSKTLVSSNLTLGQNAEYDALVKRTVDFLNKQASRLIMLPTGLVKFYLNPKTVDPAPPVIEIKQHSSGNVSILLGLAEGEIVAVTAPQTQHSNEVVRFYEDINYLRRGKNATDMYTRVYGTEGLVTNRHKAVNVLMAPSRSVDSNKRFLKALLSDSVISEHGQPSMIQIVVSGHKAKNKVPAYNSITYKVEKLEEGYAFSLVKWNDPVEEEAMYAKLHYGKNEVQFLWDKPEDVLEILKWAESRSKDSFFIHENGRRETTELCYRVCPILR